MTHRYDNLVFSTLGEVEEYINIVRAAARVALRSVGVIGVAADIKVIELFPDYEPRTVQVVQVSSGEKYRYVDGHVEILTCSGWERSLRYLKDVTAALRDTPLEDLALIKSLVTNP